MTGKMVGTCGHELPDVWWASAESYVAIKDETREGQRAVSVNHVCPECKARYEEQNLVLKTEKEEQEWLNGAR